MNEQITDIKHRLAKIETMKDYQRTLEKQRKENSTKLNAAYIQWEKENKDVEKLKHASLSSLIAWFAKDKEERLMKEEQEALKAMLVLRQLQEENEAITKDLIHCEEEIAQEDALRETLHRLQMEEALKGPMKKEVQQYAEELQQLQMLEKELQEALEASYPLTDQLQKAVDELGSASSWGIYDVFAGGMVSSMIKHSHIDHAQEAIAQIQQDMRRFQKELKDISMIELPNVQMEEWLKFSDIFFDNALFDFMALSQINDNEKSLITALASITDIQNELLDKHCACLEKQLTLKKKLERWYQ